MKYALLALLLSTFASVSSAVIIGSKDWRPLLAQSGGPGHLFGATWNEINAVFDSNSGECSSAACEIRGTDYSGWTWASISEVDSMLTTFYPEGGLFSGDLDETIAAPATEFSDAIAALGDTLSAPGFAVASGWTRDSSTSDSNKGGLVYLSSTYSFTDPPEALLSKKHLVFPDKTISEASFGIWMYRSVEVSEPAVAAIPALGVLIVLFLCPRLRGRQTT